MIVKNLLMSFCGNIIHRSCTMMLDLEEFHMKPDHNMRSDATVKGDTEIFLSSRSS